MNADIKRLAILALTSLIVIAGAGWLLVEFVVKGTVTIDGGSDGDLNVTIVSSDNSVALTGKARSYRLMPGNYTVMVTSGQGGARQLVSVSPLSDHKVSATGSLGLEAKLAVRVPLSGVVPDGSLLIGYDPIDETMKRVDRVGDETTSLLGRFIPSTKVLEPEIPGRVLVYQPYGKSRALVYTDNHQLYSIGGGLNSADLAYLNIDDGSSNELLIGSNASQDSFVLAYGNSVYKYDSVSGKPTQVYTAKKFFNHVIYGGNKIILYSDLLPNSKEDLRSAFDQQQINPLIIDLDSKRETTVDGPVTSVTLSPDGQYATFKPRGKIGYLYDTNKQQVVENLDYPKSAAPFWTSNTTYLYEARKLVWQYSVPDHVAKFVANIDASATSFSFGSKANTYYVTYYNGFDQAGIYILGSAANAPTGSNILVGITPYVTSGYSIYYSEIGKPTITIQTSAILNRASQLSAYRKHTRSLRLQALHWLKTQGVDLKQYKIVYDPADPL